MEIRGDTWGSEDHPGSGAAWGSCSRRRAWSGKPREGPQESREALGKPQLPPYDSGETWILISNSRPSPPSHKTSYQIRPWKQGEVQGRLALAWPCLSQGFDDGTLLLLLLLPRSFLLPPPSSALSPGERERVNICCGKSVLKNKRKRPLSDVWIAIFSIFLW